MLDELYFLENDEFVNLELEPESRSFRLREMFWNKTHNKGVIHKDLLGTGDNTLVGYAKDFAVLLEASEPFIQNDELIVGCSLAIPRDKSSIDLGYYNRHYPPGHAKILQMGFTGIRDYAKKRLLTENSSEKRDFLSAVQISYDAACNYAEKYAVFAEQRAVSEAQQQRKDELEKIASICHELATKKPTSFHAALQLFWFTFIFGGRGCIGRFDQWLYPFYKADIEAGKITKQDAQELLECLWIKLNYFAERTGGTSNDSLRNIVVAGQTPDGKDGCNELTYMCLSASAKLMLPEPKLNVRFFKGSPKRLLMECCRVLAKGLSMPAIYNDEVVIPAMSSELGIPIEDARDYGKINLKKASHGSVLDIAMHTSAFKEKEGLEKFCALIESFLNMPCTATLQTNVIDRDTLLDAQINPQSPEYKTLIVRVWGFSAVFVELNPELQKHVISRTEHGR